jgi:hypothetical protein
MVVSADVDDRGPKEGRHRAVLTNTARALQVAVDRELLGQL